VRNYHFIFENNDGSGGEETGQIELSDDDEAFAFGEQVIRGMMQDSSRHYEAAPSSFTRAAHLRSRPFGELSEAFLTWLLGVATWQRDRQQ
jgi:hypothetical protein